MSAFGVYNPTTAAKRGIYTNINMAVPKSTIGQLKNVDASAPKMNEALLYNETTELWEATDLTTIPQVPQKLNNLADVDVSNATNGQVLKYVAAAPENQRWQSAHPGSLLVPLGDLTNVNTAGVYDGSSLKYDVGTMNWIVQPNKTLPAIYYADDSTGDNNNSGTSGSPVKTAEVALEKALLKGGYSHTIVRIVGLGVVYDSTVKRNLNLNQMDSPGFTTFVLSGDTTNLGHPAPPPPLNPFDGNIISAYSQGSPNNAYLAAYTIPMTATDTMFVQTMLGGIELTIPCVVDAQSSISGQRIYLAISSSMVIPAFQNTQTLNVRTITDSMIINSNLNVYGPAFVTDLSIITTDSAILRFLNGVGFSYVSFKPASGSTHIIFDGTQSNCNYTTFTDVTIECRGTSSSSTFEKCAFNHCSFAACENVKFIGCIFYKNPLLFDNIKATAVFENCLFVYTNNLSTASLMSITQGSNVTIRNSSIDTRKFSDLSSTDLPLFKVTMNSNILLDNITIVDGLNSVSTPFDGNSDVASILYLDQHSTGTMINSTVNTAGGGTSAFFVVRSDSELAVSGLTTDGGNTFSLVSSINSRFQLSNIDDTLRLSHGIYGISSTISLDTTYFVTNTHLVNNFLDITNCTVKGKRVYVNLDTSMESYFIHSQGSNINLTLLPITDMMQSAILVNQSTLNMTVEEPVIPLSPNTLTLINGGTNTIDVVNATSSYINLQNIGIRHTDGMGINTDSSIINITFTNYKDDFGVTTVNANALNIQNNSKVNLSGVMSLIQSGSHTSSAIVVDNSEVSIMSAIGTTTGGGSKRLLITRDYTGMDNATVPVISVSNNSKLVINNISSTSGSDDGGGLITQNSPNIVLNGLDTIQTQSPLLINNNSSVSLYRVQIQIPQQVGPITVINGSTLHYDSPYINTPATGSISTQYFNINNSTLRLFKSLNSPVAYTPSLHINTPGTNWDVGTIGASNSNIVFADIDVQNYTVSTTSTSLIRGINNSNIQYIRPTSQVMAQYFTIGVNLRSNSKVIYSSADMSPLLCLNDIVLGSGLSGIPGELANRTIQNISVMGNNIIPVSNVADFTTYKAYLDQCEGCIGTRDVV